MHKIQSHNGQPTWTSTVNQTISETEQDFTPYAKAKRTSTNSTTFSDVLM